jgi:hypothetical protein
MALYKIPQNTGKLRVAKGLGHRWVAWNGKQGQYEFTIPCKDRKQAEEVCAIINSKDRPKEIEVNLK